MSEAYNFILDTGPHTNQWEDEVLLLSRDETKRFQKEVSHGKDLERKRRNVSRTEVSRCLRKHKICLSCKFMKWIKIKKAVKPRLMAFISFLNANSKVPLTALSDL